MSAANNRANPRDDRRERLAEVQKVQQKAEQRRNILILVISGIVALALIVPTVLFILDAQRDRAAIEDAIAQPIEGVEEFTDLSATHVQTDVTYEQSPPVGGDHNPAWQNCGFYPEPVLDENAVHSLEHGAVWLAYSGDLPQADIDALEDLTTNRPYLLVSAYEGLDSPVVASAWGLQLALDGVDDERLLTFVEKYIQGEQTPEQGAPCIGGIGA